LIHGVPFFRALDRVDRARLISALDRVEFPAGTIIFSEGDEADGLYMFETGRVAIAVRTNEEDRVVRELEAPAHFGELGLLLMRRTASARAVTGIKAWKLPQGRFKQLLKERPGVGQAIATRLAEMIDERSRESVGAPPLQPATVSITPTLPRVGWPRARRIVGAALAVGVPIVLWPLARPHGLSEQGWHVLLVLLGAAIGWLLEPVPDFVVALAMVTAWGVLGLTPLSASFSGFTSSAWVVAVGALGLGVAMARSGLLLRIALRMMRFFPPTHAGQVLALLTSGVIVTPLVPLAIARVATIASLTQELAHSLRYPGRSRASAALAFAGLIGYGAFSSIFMTGLAMNFFVIDLLPISERGRVDWIAWFIRAVPEGMVVLAGVIFALFLFLRPEITPKTTPETLRLQARALGPLSSRELVTLGGLSVLLVGLLLQPVFHIDASWLALAGVVVAMFGNVLDRETFRASMEWGFLILFGILLGTAEVLHRAGVDTWIAQVLLPLTRVGEPSVLLLIIGGLVVACRLVLPWIPTTLLLSLVLVPVAAQRGLSPWLVGFVVLVAANTWLHPNQSDFCRIMRDVTKGEMFTERHGTIMGIALTLSVLLGIALSIPFWRAIGLLAR